MLKSRFIKPLAVAIVLSALPVLAQSQSGSNVPPPPGPYTALPAMDQARGAAHGAPSGQGQSTPASQIWAAPQGQAMPYWMRTPPADSAAPAQNGTPVVASRSAPVAAPQFAPMGQMGQATPPAANFTQPNMQMFGMGQNGGFFQGYGPGPARGFMGNQGFQNQGYPNQNFGGYAPQFQMPFWGGQSGPYYPGFQNGNPAYGQFNR